MLRLFGDGWASFFITNSLVEELPDEQTVPMGNGSDGLVVSQARYQTAIHNLEDASFRLYCGIARLIENPP
ncbi:MAG TPA: hypothetical protein VGF61_07065, partial [Candidatus Acidoferrum sp.]